MDPKLISLDIETYGKWSALPEQTCFTPARSVLVDGVAKRDLLVTCSITVPTRDPRWDAAPLDAKALASLVPGDTMVLNLRRSDPAGDLHKLIAWLHHANALIGMNIQFDLLYLRAAIPLLREVLVPFRHTLIDLSVANFLEFEGRPERSLKTLGPVLGAYAYRQEDLTRLSSIPAIRAYNAQDTHNTLVALSILARRILRTFGATTPKLSPECLAFYSDTIWSCILMTEAGVPFSIPALTELRTRYLSSVQRIEHLLARDFDLLMAGEGSEKSKDAFLARCIEAADAQPNAVPVLADPRFTLTDKKKKASFSDLNREIIAARLPPRHPLARALRLIGKYNLRQKILSTYLWPLLEGARKDPERRSSILVPTWKLPWKSSPPNSLAPSASTTASSPTLPIPSPGSPSTSTNSAAFPSTVSSWTATAPSTTAAIPATTPTSSVSSTPDANTASPLPGQTSLPGAKSPAASTSTSPSEAIGLSHPSWFIVPSAFKDDAGGSGGTIQARLTCKNGAHQTDPPPVQACRRSRWPGGFLVRYDASQIELRVPAVLSGEPSMVAEYLKPKPDLHTAMTVAMFGPAILQDPHWKDGGPNDPRQVGKQGNFLILFRGGPDKFQATVLKEAKRLLPMSLCVELVRKAKEARPVLWAWQDRLINEAETKGYLQLWPTGQSRTFAGGDDYMVNEIVNYPVQSHAANVVRDIMHGCARALLHRPDILMYLNVYDALYFDVATKEAVADLDTIFQSVVRSSPYWDFLCSSSGHRIPLVFERKVL